MSTNQYAILLLIIYSGTIWFLSTRPPVYISRRKINLFRALFPSWKFYEDVCYVPILYFRIGQDGVRFSEWRPVVGKIERKWSTLFVNPEGNLIHAYNSLLQQLEDDKEDVLVDEADKLIDTASYKFVRNLVSENLSKLDPESLYFQFKLTSTMQGDSVDAEDILTSIIHKRELC